MKYVYTTFGWAVMTYGLLLVSEPVELTGIKGALLVLAGSVLLNKINERK